MSILSHRISTVLYEFLLRRVGKRRTYLWSGFASVGLGVVAAVGYIATDVVDLGSYQEVTVVPSSLTTNQGRSILVMSTGEAKYELSNRLWDKRVPIEEVVLAAQSPGGVVLWIKPSKSNNHEVRGLRAGDVYLNPSVGIALDNNNRQAILWLSVLFGAIGLSGVLCGIRFDPE